MTTQKHKNTQRHTFSDNTSRQHSRVMSHSQSGETQHGKGGAGRERLNRNGAGLETAPPHHGKAGVTLQNKHSNKPCKPFQATRGMKSNSEIPT